MAKLQAKMVKFLSGWRGDARLYKLSSPVREEESWGFQKPFDHVIVSAVSTNGEETLVFPADSAGEPLSMVEVGGWRGTRDHGEVVSAFVERWQDRVIRPRARRGRKGLASNRGRGRSSGGLGQGDRGQRGLVYSTKRCHFVVEGRRVGSARRVRLGPTRPNFKKALKTARDLDGTLFLVCDNERIPVIRCYMGSCEARHEGLSGKRRRKKKR